MNSLKHLRIPAILAVSLALIALFALVGLSAPRANAAGSAARPAGMFVAAQESETAHPEATETQHPEATETEHPEATETHHPEATETEHPEATHTEHPEATETEHPEATETHHPEGTETPHPEATETHHPEGTETPHPEATETHHPEGTETPHPTTTGTPQVAPALPGTGSRSFPQTGRTVVGLFLSYWDGHGGLAQQGYPISPVMRETSDLNGKPYTVQYFERAVLEYHPENAAPFDVLLSQLGTFQYRQKYPNGAPGQQVDQTNGHFFAETGHWVGSKFWAYWQAHGGLAQQGYPLSDEFTEISPLNGKPYTVQYFERAVFEMHPENVAPFGVLLSQLGTFQYQQKHGR
jgi:outer membrane biosynthesis protein TonB